MTLQAPRRHCVRTTLRPVRDFARKLLRTAAPLGLLAAGLGASPMQAQSVLASAAVVPAGAADLGPLASGTGVALTLHLEPTADRAAALAAYETAVITPGSPSYHQWLSPSDFASRFGATADQLDRVQRFVAASQLKVVGISASGLRVSLTGTAAAVEAAFAPQLHTVTLGGRTYTANVVAPTTPSALGSDLVAIHGLDTLPASYPWALSTASSAAGTASTDADGFETLADGVDAATQPVIALASTACLEDVSASDQAAAQLMLQQAAVEGVTVLASSGCGARGSASFPGVLPEVVSVAVGAAIVPGTSAQLATLRPSWQSAAGLPADALRHEPDFTIASLATLQQALQEVESGTYASSLPATGSLGNLGARIYEVAPEAGIFTQTDNAAAGTWEAPTGLGVANLSALVKAMVTGTAATTVTLTPTPYSITHGQNVVFNTTVAPNNGSGNGATPTGTVTLSFSPGGQSVTLNLSGGTVSFNSSQLPTPLAAGNYTVTATYSGDTTFAANSATNTLQVQTENLTLSATPGPAATVGGNYTVNVTLTAPSLTGSPAGTVTVSPQGASAVTASFTATNGVATVPVSVPATQGGSVVVQVACTVTDPSYTCFSNQTLTITVAKATPTVTVSIQPNPPVYGQQTTLTAALTSAGNGAPPPTGTVNFTDSAGTSLNPGTSSNGSASTQSSVLSGTVTHTITASYAGDANYNPATGSANSSGNQITTTLALKSSVAAVVVNGTTQLTATLSLTTTLNGLNPSGTVTFYSGAGVTLGSATLTNGQLVATLTPSLTTQGTLQIYAKYSGDTNYAASTSNTVPVLVGPATGVAITSNPTTTLVYGNQVMLTAIITATPTDGTSTLAGKITFNLTGAANTTAAASAVVTGQTLTATATIPSPAVGKYAITVSCTQQNFDCTNISTTSTALTVTKGPTTTVLVVSPSTYTANEAVSLTATVTPTSATTPTGTTYPLTGSVTFYDNGTAIGNAVPLAGSSATTSVTTTSATDVLTATYNGDGNWATSTSTGTSGGGSNPASPVATTTALTSSTNSALAGSPVVLTATVSIASGSIGTTSYNPSGNVTFYDTYNGQLVTLGQVALTVSGANVSIAQLSTAALQAGTHSIYATFAGSTYYITSTSAAQTVTMTDYSLALSPTAVTLAAGGSTQVKGTITALSGFTGTVSLGCTAPAGSGLSCSFSPNSIGTSGSSTLTITASSVASLQQPRLPGSRREIVLAGSFGAALLLLWMPTIRRRRPVALLVVAFALLAGASTLSGCTYTNLQGNNAGSGGGGSSTPSGTSTLTITVSGTDGRTTTYHNTTLSVTVQ